MLGFANARNAVGADNASGSGIIGRQCLFQIAVEPVELFAQVTRPTLEIGEWIVRVHTQVACSARHQLREPARADRRHRIRAPAAFLPDESFYQCRAEIEARCKFGDLGLITLGNKARMLAGIGHRNIGNEKIGRDF